MGNQAFSRVLILVIMVILISGGILVWQYLGVPKEKIGGTVPEAPEEEVLPEEGIPEEITEKEIATCKDIQGLNKQNECFLNLAIKTGDPAACYYLPQGFSFERLSSDLCLNTLAILTNTPSLCRRDNYCPTSVFMYNTDLCQDINVDVADYVKKGCPGDVNCDLRYPLFKEKIGCLEQTAIEKGDFELCKKIDSEDCQKKVAIKLNNPGMCRQLPIYRGSCLTELAIKNKDTKLCENRKECIVQVALHYNDSDFCKELSNKESQDRCYYDFGIEIGRKANCELCEKIPNEIAQRYCMLEVAVTINDNGFCEKLDINIEDLITKYSDGEFSFSFYYPKSWQLSKNSNSISLTEVGPYGDFITITKYIGQRIKDSDAKFGDVTYYYDNNKNQWMEDYNTVYNPGIHPAEPNFYTLSGLPVFGGTGRWKTNIVALSPDKFLDINISGSGWTRILDPLTKTVIKTDQEIEDTKLKKALIEEILSLKEIF